ncbi:MAG: T9SS type A sorting domain-containing protein [Bacteroidales bacterium]|nr:T9SS type A sorting domain-containing protein [Bacteroidales bacterium]
MKKAILTSLIIVFCFGVFGQNWVNINSSNPVTAQAELISSNIDNSIIEFNFDGFMMNEVQTPRGIAYTISIEKTTPLLQQGAPDLPKMTSSVIIPDLAKMEVKLVSSSFEEFTDIEIAPSKGNFTRDIDPETVPYLYGKQYNEDRFFPKDITSLREPYIIRDYRGQTVVISPFQYNPVSKILRVYYNITVKIEKVNDNGINPLIRKSELTSVNTEFDKIYSRHFMNTSSSKYDPVDEHGNMLIIAYEDFIDAMQPFIDWKIQTGIPVEIVDVATIGNSSAIKNYIQDYYDDNGLTFVLLVGDAAQVPTSYSNGDSDNNYSYVAGNDHYPDLFIGRFSAETIAHVETQVSRTITYEQDPYRDEDWFSKGIGIASDQGPGDEGEYDYEHMRNIRNDLLGFTYTSCSELYDGSQGGEDEPGNPTPAMVAEKVNEGASIINYAGHGSSSGWGSSGFSSYQINNLTNNGMLPFIWSVACLNGNFVNQTCFAEAWMRAENNDEPIGAIATLMSTNNQDWYPPMDAQDEMDSLLVESYQNNIKRTFGGLSMNGCMHMNDNYGTSGYLVTDTWTCFGDPSLMVRTAMPAEMTATYNSSVIIGCSEIIVTCNAEGGLVALTLDGEIISTAFVEGGSATLQFDPLTNIGSITITITAFNYVPHIGNIEILTANGPYVIYESHVVNDSLGNNNGIVDYDEDITFDVVLENVGTEDAVNVSATISTDDDYVTITDDTQEWGDIATGETSLQEDAFAVTVDDSIPDQYIVTYNMIIQDDSKETWNSQFTTVLNAPVLSVGTMVIDDSQSGNGDGRLDEGETADIIISASNSGHSNAFGTIANLTSTSTDITINISTFDIDTLLFGTIKNAVFNVTVNPIVPLGTPITFDFTVESGFYLAEKQFTTLVGLLVEDFETGTFENFGWTFIGDADWFICTENPYEGENCAQSGDIDDEQKSQLFTTVNVMLDDSISFFKKVSCEDDMLNDDYDYLAFYIDNTEMGRWDGEVAWSREVYPVTAGMHKFKWSYSKNYIVSSGSDCAWVDYIVFPPIDEYVFIEDNFNLPSEFSNYPNPFSSSTNITFIIPKSSKVNIEIYNINGQKVCTLLDEIKSAGIHKTTWIAESTLPEGIYFLKFTSGNITETKKMILMR